MPNQYLPPVIAIPSSLLITNITQSIPMVLTVAIGNPTTEVNTYLIGQLIKITVPKTWGMFQANGLIGKIINIGTNTISVNIDSTQFDNFIYNPTSSEAPASISPAGSQNVQFSNQTQLLPFQSLNNIGN